MNLEDLLAGIESEEQRELVKKAYSRALRLEIELDEQGYSTKKCVAYVIPDDDNSISKNLNIDNFDKLSKFLGADIYIVNYRERSIYSRGNEDGGIIATLADHVYLINKSTKEDVNRAYL